MNIVRLAKNMKSYAPKEPTLFELKIYEQWGQDFEEVSTAVQAWISSVIALRRTKFGARWKDALLSRAQRILQSNADRRMDAFSINAELREMLTEFGFEN